MSVQGGLALMLLITPFYNPLNLLWLSVTNALSDGRISDLTDILAALTIDTLTLP